MNEAEHRQEPPSQAHEPESATLWQRLASPLRRPAALWPRHPLLTVAFAVFVAVNIVLVAGYLWSRGGQTVHVRVEAQGDHFTSYVDDRLTAEADLDAPDAGGIILIVSDTHNLPSLPEPRGVDSVRVTELDSGEVLFEDDFSSGFSSAWLAHNPQAFSEEDGVLGVRGRGILELSDVTWRDYAVDIRYKNIESANLLVRARDTQSGVSYNLRPFRHFDNSLALRDEGQTVTHVRGLRLELSRGETIKSLVAMALDPYPFALLLLVLGFIVVLVLQFVIPARLPFRLPRASPDLPWVAAAVITGGAFALALFLMSAFNARLPHVPDAVSYIFQAKLLASGELSAPPPPVANVFDFFYPPFIVLSNDKWASVYPMGHPLMLAIGARVDAMWVIPPLLGATTVGLLFVIGRRVYNSRVGVLAALLLATSPFFLMTSSNFMSHNTAAFYVTASLLFLVFVDKRPVLYGLLAGLFFGLLFNTRLLTAVGLIPPFGLFLLTLALPRERRLMGIKQIGGFVAGGLLMLGAYWLYNWGTTGDAFTSGYQAGAEQLSERIGFGGRHSVNAGIQHEQTQMTFLLLVVNGWPQYIGLMFVLLPFMLGTRHRWDWFLLGSAVFAIGAYTLFDGNGVMHGPRYWYEAVPFLMLLAARGADAAAELLADSAGRLRSGFSGVAVRPIGISVLVVYALVGALVGSSIHGWLLSNNSSWNAMFVPARATELKGFNGIDDRLVRLLDEADLENALVLVEVCRHWQCFGNVFWMNEPGLDGDVVFAENLPEHRAGLFATYPDRRVYLADYQAGTLVPFGASPESDLAEAPLAEEIPIATPTPAAPPPPTPTTDPMAAARRDAQRQQDLAAVAEALQDYYDRHGAYPLAEGLQSLCRYRHLDAGCQLTEILDPLPLGPPGTLYWYQSDGESFFLLYVAMEEPPGPSPCPDPVPEALSGAENLYCVRGSPQQPP